MKRRDFLKRTVGVACVLPMDGLLPRQNVYTGVCYMAYRSCEGFRTCIRREYRITLATGVGPERIADAIRLCAVQQTAPACGMMKKYKHPGLLCRVALGSYNEPIKWLDIDIDARPLGSGCWHVPWRWDARKGQCPACGITFDELRLSKEYACYDAARDCHRLPKTATPVKGQMTNVA